MIQVYPDEGLSALATLIQLGQVRVGLFENNVTISKTTVFADLTTPSTFGYADFISSSSWVVSTSLVANVLTAKGNDVPFIPVGGNWTIYGYFVTFDADNTLLWSANFDGAPLTVVPVSGIVVPLQFALYSQLP